MVVTTCIMGSVGDGYIQGTHNLQIHYLAREADGVIYNIIRQKHNVPPGHPSLTRPDITALGRAQHCEAVFKGIDVYKRQSLLLLHLQK